MAKKKTVYPSFARCNQCKLVFKDASDCATHATLRGHERNPSYHCTVCSETFARLKFRSDHIKTVGHVQTGPKTYASPTAPVAPASSSKAGPASRVASLPAQPVASTSSAPKVKAPPLAPSVSNCPACDKEFKNAAALADHRKAVHLGPVKQPQVAASSASQPKRSESETQKPRCVTCQLNFPSQDTLQAHYDMSLCHPSCVGCRLGFDSPASLADHKKRCPALKLKSPIAASPAAPGVVNGRATAQADPSSAPSTSLPTPSTGEEQPYLCNDCYHVIDSAHMIAAHTTATGHKGFTPFIAEVACPDCPQKFKTIAGLQKRRADAHSRPASVMQEQSSSQSAAAVHTEANGEVQAAATAPLAEETRCDKCSIGFSGTEDLQAHYDESPLHPTCRTCGLGFASIGPWAAHKARCPPPGSTTNSAMDGRGTAGPSQKGKEVARDVVSPAERIGPDADESASSEDVATAGDRDTNSTSLSSGPSDASSSVTPTAPTVSDMTKPQRFPSPTPSATASTGSTVSYARCSSPGISQPPLRDDQADLRDRILRAKRTEPSDHSLVDPGTEPVQTHGRPDSEEVRVAAGLSARGSPGAYPTPLSGSTRSQTPIDPLWQRAETSRPSTDDDSSGTAVSFHCRSCLRDPCVQPVATMCGHLFCHRCIVQELSTKLCCPVCQQVFFVRLHVEVD